MSNLPFAYLIGWSQLGIWYYGVRYAQDCHPSDLWTTYFTSSIHVTDFRNLNGEPDVITVRKTFPGLSVKEGILVAKKWENRVLHWFDVINNPAWLNRHNGNTAYLSTLGLAPAKITLTGEGIGLVPTDDPRWETGEIVGVHNGKRGASLHKGFIAAYDEKEGCVRKCHPLDERLINGQLITLDMAKQKGYSIDLGEAARGSVTRYDVNGKRIRAFPNDPEVISGKWKTLEEAVALGWPIKRQKHREETAYVYDEKGKRQRVKTSDARIMTGELKTATDAKASGWPVVYHLHGKIKGYNKEGKGFRVNPDDKRFETGELITSEDLKKRYAFLVSYLEVNAATVQDIEIISALTSTNLRTAPGSGVI
jgi:hypothetical protein